VPQPVISQSGSAGPYSSPFALQVSAAKAKRLLASPAQALAAVRDLGARAFEMFARVKTETGMITGAWFALPRQTHRLVANTHRPVTNSRSNRDNDFRRVSHGATRFGHQTNHSDGDGHVSTIRLSQGQGQRVLWNPFPSGFQEMLQ
jgi:hypothetical protein